MENNSNYTIKLSQFEGPFDLLLFFIERDELDIYDIPELSSMEDDQYFRIPRGNIQNEFQALSQKALVDAEWETLTLFNLLKVFQKVVTRLDQSKFVVHKIYNYEYTIGEQQEKIRYTLKISGKADFEKLFEECENRIHAIITFLALLEMVNLQQLKITKGENLNQFWVEEKPEEEQDLDPQNNNLEEE